MALPEIFDYVLHVDKKIQYFLDNYGTTTYWIMAGIVFCETGLVFLPFLPGDSLLFAAGAFSAMGKLDVAFVFFLLTAAAIVGLLWRTARCSRTGAKPVAILPPGRARGLG